MARSLWPAGLIHRFSKVNSFLVRLTVALDNRFVAMDEKSPGEKGLFKVIRFGSALSFGLLGAIIGSMKDFFHGEAALSFSWKTVVGFVLGFIIGWLPWKWIAKKTTKSE